nr:Chain A, 16X_BCL [Inovirus M13]
GCMILLDTDIWCPCSHPYACPENICC